MSAELTIESLPAEVQGLASAIAQHVVKEVVRLLKADQPKDWYSTDELAQALGKARWTIQEKWCNAGRIECEKDEESGKWRIPGYEFRRLVNGGKLRPKPT